MEEGKQITVANGTAKFTLESAGFTSLFAE
jgi:hypothetical protein